VLSASVHFLRSISQDVWLNDDIALPLSARMLFPKNRILYWRPNETTRRVSDVGIEEEKAQFARRRRMVIGNLQWILFLWPRSLYKSPSAALLGLRRIARLFWAYGGLLILFAFFSFVSGSSLVAAGLSLSAAILFSALLFLVGKRGIVEAAIASLASPGNLPPVEQRRSGKTKRGTAQQGGADPEQQQRAAPPCLPAQLPGATEEERPPAYLE
jgi:hypothetical protein